MKKPLVVLQKLFYSYCLERAVSYLKNNVMLLCSGINKRVECLHLHSRIFGNLAFSVADHISITEKQTEGQIDLKQKCRSFTKEFHLKVVKYYCGNMENNNKTATIKIQVIKKIKEILY